MDNGLKSIHPAHISFTEENKPFLVDNERARTGQYKETSLGLNKREYMATQAMVGFISSRKDALFILSDETLEKYATKSVQMADTLLKQLENKQK